MAGYAGLLLATPTVLYEVVAYVLPGLTRSERRLLAPIIFGSSILFYLGCAACAAVFSVDAQWPGSHAHYSVCRHGMCRSLDSLASCEYNRDFQGSRVVAGVRARLHCRRSCSCTCDQAELQQTACSLVLAPMGGCHCMTQILRAQAAVLVRGADAGGAELLCQLCGRRGRVAVVDRPVL